VNTDTDTGFSAVLINCHCLQDLRLVFNVSNICFDTSID